MMQLPKVTFRKMTFEENMNTMAMFIKNELDDSNQRNTNFFRNRYSEIANLDFNGLDKNQISDILKSKLMPKWLKNMENADHKARIFQADWDLINDEVITELSKSLNITWPINTMDIQARIGILYASPRYIGPRIFDTTINYNEIELRKVTIHEICHFLYFEKWKELFNDYDESHYNHPHLAWYLSEAIIDPLLNNETFTKYTNGPIKSYDVFYETMINDQNIIDLLIKNVQNKPIEIAIKDSYDLFLANEEIITNNYNNPKFNKRK